MATGKSKKTRRNRTVDKYSITMTKSPDLSEDEVRHRLAQVYSLLIDLGRQAKSDAPAESTRTGAGASDGTPSVAGRQAHDTPTSIQEQV
jgi:hypothetical protein